MLTYIAPDEVLGVFEEQGGAAVQNGQVMNVGLDLRVTGAIEDILAHPVNADILYVGAINGGIWKTTDATAVNPTWVAQTRAIACSDVLKSSQNAFELV